MGFKDGGVETWRVGVMETGVMETGDLEEKKPVC